MKALSRRIAVATLAISVNAHALTPHETFYVQDAPQPEQIASWSSLPGTRSYLINVGDPISYALEPLLALKGADRLQIELTRYPGEDAAPVLKRLAGQGAELVTLDAGLPTDDEISRLNDIGFSHHVFVLSAFPGDHDGKRLARLKAPVHLTFVTRLYPRFVDKEAFLNIPAAMPLLFSTDYWPWYSHMDVMNMFPQRKSLRVKDMFPPEESLQYLLNIKNLDEVTVDSDFDAPESATWNRFGALKVRWSSRGRVPYEAGLASFEASRTLGQRRLIIDSDQELTKDERARLERSPLAVERIHLAPNGYLSPRHRR